MLVHQILQAKPSSGVLTIAPGTRVSEAVHVMSEKRVGALVVSEDGQAPRGILSERDVVRELGRRGSGCLTDSVDALMTKDLVTCTGDDTGEQVLTKMTDGRFRHMPVMADGSMVGLISIGDVVKARLSELSMEKEALEGMIMGY